eukprot:745886-Hanusia_phi.AAC.5
MRFALQASQAASSSPTPTPLLVIRNLCFHLLTNDGGDGVEGHVGNELREDERDKTAHVAAGEDLRKDQENLQQQRLHRVEAAGTLSQAAPWGGGEIPNKAGDFAVANDEEEEAEEGYEGDHGKRLQRSHPRPHPRPHPHEHPHPRPHPHPHPNEHPYSHQHHSFPVIISFPPSSSIPILSIISSDLCKLNERLERLHEDQRQERNLDRKRQGSNSAISTAGTFWKRNLP